MGEFIKRTFLFALLVVAALAVGEVVVRHIPTSYSHKREWMDAHAREVKTLILGSSHTYYGLSPAEIGDSVFNLANISQTPEYDLALLQKWMPEMTRLKRVIIPVSYFSFRDPKMEEGGDWRLCQNYQIDMCLGLHSPLSRYNFKISDFAGWCGMLRGLVLTQEHNHCDSLGFGLGFDIDHRARDWKERAPRRTIDVALPPDAERSADVARVYGEIIELLAAKEVECVFLTTPVHKLFRENMERKQYGEMVRMRDSIAAQYSLRVIDLFSDTTFTDDDFHDADHLSDLGASRLSERLAQAID